MPKNSIFPAIPANVADDCVCTQLESNSSSEELYVCSECKEWTSDEDVLDGDEVGGSCCGVGPSNHEYEKDYER
jgi:hypothetical protein